MYKKFKPVKEYFDFYVNPDEEKLLARYKERVDKELFPGWHYAPKISEAKKVLNDFKRLGVSGESLADLLLYYVERGVYLIIQGGYDDSNLYDSVASTYGKALAVIDSNGLWEKFQSRALKIMDDTGNVGWGLYFRLQNWYDRYC